MDRILTINELKDLNKESENLEQSFEILKIFISDESTQAFLGEDNPFGRKEDFIMVAKRLIENIDKTKIIIRPDDHNPPHFHVKIAEYEASYYIENCNCSVGNIPKTYENKIKIWYKNGGKEKLIQNWNDLKK